MTRLAPLLLALVLLPAAAQAACYAEYKARRDSDAGIRLHYGIMDLDGACPDAAEARETVAARLRDGWQLLGVTGLSTSAPTARQRRDAGAFYLRY
ncbi:hypothetical protein [Allosediminivita pacifica]|uniref:DUF1737 domain-containing protein n=1 Tax=Allosediminivita pacifica TaxID=1267769 RepID=A0A2T6AZJ7_9RHOB|nr:hypothetical protein [Allosediminivita pacifica]PTX49220.1 hypothetical protein C8N44_10760 [Allosediminivita pacifica]GGB05768.1 hypothetical protein GCM10011324_14880 [Allosediminivita pacifica]